MSKFLIYRSRVSSTMYLTYSIGCYKNNFIKKEIFKIMNKFNQAMIKFIIFITCAIVIGLAVFATIEGTYYFRYAVDYKQSLLAVASKFGESAQELFAVAGNLKVETPVTLFEIFVSNWLSLVASLALGIFLTWGTRWDKNFSNELIKKLEEANE